MRKRIFHVFCISTILLVGAVLLYCSDEGGAGIPCPVYLFTGFYCAGCGASRALRSILHLQFYQALRYNPVMVLLLPALGVYVVSVAVSYVKTGENRVDAKLSFRWLYLLAIMVFIYSVVRNLPFLPFTLLRPTVVS